MVVVVEPGGLVVVVDAVVVVVDGGGAVVLGGGAVVAGADVGGGVVTGTDVAGGTVGTPTVDVVDGGSVLVVDEVVVVASCSESWSGVAVNSGSTGTPSRPARMVAAKMLAGNEPPVTRRPWTFSIGVIFVGSPTHTAVAAWGT